MPSWMPDWRKLMEEAPEIAVPPGEGFVYLIADSHLGDARAPTGEFFAMLSQLPQARLVVFLGDLFKVWLAMPKFWDRHTREILDGFANLRASGVPILFVVGNREFFLPADPATAHRRGLPFDHIVNGACVLRWGELRWGMTHGDVVNRRDHRHLKWRRISRSRAFEAVFKSMPGWLARNIANRLERAMAGANRDIKVQYPLDELQAFGAEVMGGLDGFFLGHFHRDEVIAVPGNKAPLRIVPDWHSRKIVLRLDRSGAITPVPFSSSQGISRESAG
jgi:UDP-2,3-diacylglucosamine pyrophosphatase LpxH